LKTRILYILPAGEKGGAEVVFLNILENLDRSVFEPFVIVLKDGPFISELQKHDVTPVVVNTNRLRSIKGFFEITSFIRKIIEDEQIDVVHCNGTGAQIYGGYAAGLTGTQCIYHLHDSVEWSWSRQGLAYLLAQLSFPISQIFSRRRSQLHFIAVSKYIADKFQQTWGSKKNISVIHNATRRANVATTLATNQNPVIVWIGRLQRWKGAHIFIKAAAIIHKQHPEVQFKIVGGSLFGIEVDYEKELHNLAQTLNVENVLTFTGHQSSSDEFIQSADVVVHSSIRPEPFGLVIVEAMNAGKAVIASNEGGPVEIVEQGVTGLLIPPEDPEKLANAIITLLQDASLRTKMGQAAQLRVKENFTASKMIDALEGLYSQLAADNVKQQFQNEHHQEKNISSGIRQRL
jgi:glycosyltransferase involved in cell wall biosynthesis